MEHDLRRFKAEIFQALANPTRIAIVELLRDEGEASVGRVTEALGVEQANASQHLAVLRNKYVVLSRKEGNVVHYRLRDKSLGRVLDLMKAYFTTHLMAATEQLADLQDAAGKK